MPDSRRIRNAASGKRQKYNGWEDPVGVTPAGFCIEGKGSGFKVQGCGGGFAASINRAMP